MLSPKAQMNLKHAKSYFREHLSVGDYYSVEAQVRGEWFGEGAGKLGLAGLVTEDAFIALCEGQNPKTGERLTQRLNSLRRDALGCELANRRVFYDFTISPPKSVSVVALYQDDRILALHDRAVRAAMNELEKFSGTRVRKLGEQENRETGNLIGAAFRHDIWAHSARWPVKAHPATDEATERGAQVLLARGKADGRNGGPQRSEDSMAGVTQ